MSLLYDGWDVVSLLACLTERIQDIRTLCEQVMATKGVSNETRLLAENILRELEGEGAS